MTSANKLHFDQTVLRELVHRRAIHEVLLTDSHQESDDQYLVGCQLTRGHRLFGDRRGTFHDPLLVLEAARQATVLIAHQYCAVPMNWGFIANAMSAKVTDLAAWRYRDHPGEAVIDMRTSDRQYRDGLLRGMAFQIGVTIDEAPAAILNGALMFMPPESYRQLRAGIRAKKKLDVPRPAPAKRLRPVEVGRYDERNVVLAETTAPTRGEQNRFGVVVDRENPSLFDHELDHLPAIYLIEVFRQAALATMDRSGQAPAERLTVTACESGFTDFTELDLPTECVVELTRTLADGRTELLVGIEQAGRTTSTARIELSEAD